MLPFKPDHRYQTYWRQFREGRFAEARATLEPLCHAGEETDRVFYGGLLELAGSLHHLHEGDMARADAAASEARGGLQQFGSSYRGVQLQSLLLGLECCLEDARRTLDEQGRIGIMRPRIPRVDLAYGLDPESTSD